ncbi:hypothetical protein F2Q69_00053007 [Brassica cretica]|uniref:Uncharacterized protein n=1 Tax=Brassica cretica TaxID=69181 RepID=A0A8S9MWP0_BRACR|nr:hypothetical protein F2Q69_00053007 [Brassica cretica]
MHGFVSYRRFGRARSLRSDRTERTLGRYVATELGLSATASSVRFKRVASQFRQVREIKPKKLDTEPVRSQLRGDFLLGRDQAE